MTLPLAISMLSILAIGSTYGSSGTSNVNSGTMGSMGSSMGVHAPRLAPAPNLASNCTGILVNGRYVFCCCTATICTCT